MTQFTPSGQLTTPMTAEQIATAGAIPVYVKNPGGAGIFGHRPAPNRNRVTFTVQ